MSVNKPWEKKKPKEVEPWQKNIIRDLQDPNNGYSLDQKIELANKVMDVLTMDEVAKLFGEK